MGKNVDHDVSLYTGEFKISKQEADEIDDAAKKAKDNSNTVT